MDVKKKRRYSENQSKKDKKLKKLINKSDSDSDESEHELSHYLGDRVKLMKEVLKIIKPKKIKSMAPDCMKKLDNEEINSMLLEELLGISNKRLKYIFNGQNLEEDSSSTDPETEQQPIDVISLDDISDDDFVINLDSENDVEEKKCRKHSKPRIKEECKRKKIKKEKQDKTNHNKSTKKSKATGKDKMDEQNLMSVLELLELQARARAIKSQLVLEGNKKAQEEGKSEGHEETENDDAIIIESPKNIEIVITSSESEDEQHVSFLHVASQKNTPENKNSDIENETNVDENNQDKNIEIVITSSESEDEQHVKSNYASQKNTPENKNSDIENKTNVDENNLKENEDAHKNISNSTEELNTQEQDSSGSSKEVTCQKNHQEVEKANKPLENKKPSEIKNKISNVETIIISLPRSQKYSSENKSPINPESDKNKESDDTTLTSETDRNVNKDSTCKPQQSQTLNNSIDDGDGIIISMEQSEIDCIICD